MKERKTDCIATVGSMTYALKAQQALAHAAIPSEVVKAEPPRAGRGCIYGVRFFCPQEQNVKAVLSAAHISVKQWTGT
ncbi:MAG: DUF3343 domain-containing protein [Clostridia bacterium]|nr:DUF3343 domain-containing protein [Clostridia bacterium]